MNCVLEMTNKSLKFWPEDLPASVAVERRREGDMDVLRFSCSGGVVATVGCGYKLSKSGAEQFWATVYNLEGLSQESKNSAVYLLRVLKSHYKKHRYSFAYSFADTGLVRHVLWKASVEVREF